MPAIITQGAITCKLPFGSNRGYFDDLLGRLTEPAAERRKRRSACSPELESARAVCWPALCAGRRAAEGRGLRWRGAKRPRQRKNSAAAAALSDGHFSGTRFATAVCCCALFGLDRGAQPGGKANPKAVRIGDGEVS